MAPFGFYMADLPDGNPTINGVNVAYVADAEMGIIRYDHTSAGPGGWTFSYYINSTGSFDSSDYSIDASGNITATNSFDPNNTNNDDVAATKAGGVRGLTGRVVNGQVQLFAVTGFSVGAQPNPGGNVIEVTDPVGGNGGTSPYTVLATNPSNETQATLTSNINASELTSIAFTPTQTVTTTAIALTDVTSQTARTPPERRSTMRPATTPARSPSRTTATPPWPAGS